jgi:phospholipid/cholesterol/gamma-HCH transport system substrate-binding protein
MLAIAALFLAAVLVSFVTGGRGFFWQQYELKTRFPDVQGLKAGAVVRVAGVEVGSVDRVEFVGAEVEVTLRVHNRMQSRITDQSRASIGALSLLGEAVIDITPSTSGRPLNSGDMIAGVPPRGQLSSVADSATKGLDQATQLLTDIRAGKGTVGRLFTDDALYREVTDFVDAAERVTNSLQQGRGTLGRLINDPALYASLNSALGDMSAITARLNRGEGSLGRLLHDDAFARSLQSTTNTLDELSNKINAGQGSMGKLVNDPALFNRLNSVSERLDKVLAGIEEGRGSVGQLLHDKQLYENMNAAIRELRDFLAEVKKDPKKYLNVKVSIF